MASTATQFRIEAVVRGIENVESLKNAVKRLQSTAQPAASDIDRLKQAATALGSATDRTENDLRTAVAVLKDLRANVALNDAEFKKLTQTIISYDKQLEKATATGGRFQKFGRIAGPIAAAGVFGGPEGAIGAGIGGLIGGAPGALAGGAIGAQVAQVRQALAAAADYSAELEKQRIALRQVAGSTDGYRESLSFIQQVSKDFAIPQDILIKNFTRLSASVLGAGGNVKDAKDAFIGITAGIRGTGGSLENLDAALLATSQVFSKGKVSAEELRGQIGERLPGAFTLFASAIGKTPQQLDKALKDGSVSLNDFETFSKALFTRYGEAAKIIASSPESAGNRLETTLKSLQESIGTLLLPIGAAFQNTFSGVFEVIDSVVRKLNEFFNLTPDRQQAELVAKAAALRKSIKQSQEDLAVPLGDPSRRDARVLASLPLIIKQQQAELLATEIRLKKFNVPKQTPGAGLGGTQTDQAAADAAAKKALQEQSELNQLIQQNLRLNVERGIIGKDRLSQLTAELDLAKQLTDLRIEDAKLTSSNEKIRQQKIINAQAEFTKEAARIAKNKADTLKDIDDISKGVQIAADKFFNRATKEDDPFTQAFKKAKLEIQDFQKLLQDALDKLAPLGGNRPETRAARNAIAALRMRSGDPNLAAELASENTIGADIRALRNQRDTLRLNGRELTELEKLKQKYLEGWDQLDPKLRAQAETLATQIDSLRQLQTITNSIADSLGSGLTNAFNALIDGTNNWGAALREIASTVLKDIAKQLIQILIIDQAISFFRSVFSFGGGGGGAGLSNLSAPATINNPLGFLSPSANGNVFAANGIVPYAMGGIVDKPTLFPFAKGIGLMGEAGPEAIMPLKRGRDGRLGVAGGGGTTNVVVNVDASGSSVEGDKRQAKQLGAVVSAAVQAELIKQKRPGGLLA